MKTFLACALALSLAGPLLADDAEDKAAKAVEDLGGKVVRDDKAPGKPVVQVSLAGSDVTDADLKSLAGVKNLQQLDLNETKITDAGLKDLAGFKELHLLRLAFTKTTDAGIADLEKALPDCKVIH